MNLATALDIRQRQLQGEFFAPDVVAEAVRTISEFYRQASTHPRDAVQKPSGPGVDIDAVYRTRGLKP